jgi:Acyl-CoA thioesterase C-terminal domain/Acyl-CoA thioesterase N-terminal domain
MTLEAVFVRDGQVLQATELGRGPWDPRALHGGAPAALLVHAFERCEPQEGQRLARVTYEFVRPVPLGELVLDVRVTRPGRRVMWLEGSIREDDGAEVVRARALRLRPSQFGETAPEPPPFPGPETGRANDFAHDGLPMFATDALDIRFVEGTFRQAGRATAWFRLRHPIVAGEPISPLVRVAAAGDFGNGIANALSWDEYVFINPDLTLYFEREPRGEWVAVQAQTRVAPGRVAVAESVLWDAEGRIGRAIQSLFVARR